MKRIKIKRVSKSYDCEMGVFIDVENGIPFLASIERPDKDNKKYISCIPKGVYLCEKYTSEKYKDVYEVKDVPNRSKILIHAANIAEELEGCIAPGCYFGQLQEKAAVLKSKNALEILKEKCGEKFTLIIE